MKRILGIALLTTLFACNQAEKKTSEVKDSAKKDSILTKNIVSLKDENATLIFNQYEDLKNALVKSDSVNAQKYATQLKETLSKYPEVEVTTTVADKISKSGNLASQRKDFTLLSSNLITLFKTKDLASGTIYVQHCPMANKGDGGDWLSSNKEIRNPYYGDEMLECGRVTEEIKTK